MRVQVILRGCDLQNTSIRHGRGVTQGWRISTPVKKAFSLPLILLASYSNIPWVNLAVGVQGLCPRLQSKMEEAGGIVDGKDQAKCLSTSRSIQTLLGSLGELGPEGMRELMLIKCPSGGWHFTGWT